MNLFKRKERKRQKEINGMILLDLSTFSCSNCGSLTPDRDLEKLAMIRVENSKLQIICPDCIEKEVKDREVNKRRQSMVVLTTIN